VSYPILSRPAVHANALLSRLATCAADRDSKNKEYPIPSSRSGFPRSMVMRGQRVKGCDEEGKRIMKQTSEAKQEDINIFAAFHFAHTAKNEVLPW
jgi:hypothetical protein